MYYIIATASSSPTSERKADSATASKTSLHRRSSAHDLELEYKNQLDKLREEYEAKEKISQSQIEEIKTKSRKKLALLQSQLTETNNKFTTEKKSFDAELNELMKQLEKLHGLNHQQGQELTSCNEENTNLQEKIRQLEEELQQVKEELRLSQQHSVTPNLKSDTMHSIHSHGQSPMQSMSMIPLIALEEVLDDQPDSQVLMSGSADLGMGETSEIFPASLEQSAISMDPAPLGSPLQSPLHSGSESLRQVAPQSSPPQCSISVLAMSRLSHHSSSMAHVSDFYWI